MVNPDSGSSSSSDSDSDNHENITKSKQTDVTNFK